MPRIRFGPASTSDVCYHHARAIRLPVTYHGASHSRSNSELRALTDPQPWSHLCEFACAAVGSDKSIRQRRRVASTSSARRLRLRRRGRRATNGRSSVVRKSNLVGANLQINSRYRHLQATEIMNPFNGGFCAVRAIISDGLLPSMISAWSPDLNRSAPSRLARPTNSGRKPRPRPASAPWRDTPSVRVSLNASPQSLKAS